MKGGGGAGGRAGRGCALMLVSHVPVLRVQSGTNDTLYIMVSMVPSPVQMQISPVIMTHDAVPIPHHYIMLISHITQSRFGL